MSNKMLIDASHPEETRVVVTKGNRIEEFDFESEHKKQLKGNIYLARVTRVEPSLQAAFVEYGGNRHGFLAFSEIHPDYYQIPVADRQALLEAEESSARDEEDNHGHSASAEDAAPVNEGVKDDKRRKRKTARAEAGNIHISAEVSAESESIEESAGDDSRNRNLLNLSGAEDALEEVPKRPAGKHGAHRHDYKIQEVVKRRQILLVQIVKEERGNKGAALTTYLSLAGRYSVLMPNTARGGGISRKITISADRKRLKDIVKDLSVPKGMGIILRTAGASRTKTEVRRDYEYLMRLWENVRNLTMTSIAPALVYEEGSLIKRSIRDLYNKDITEVSVAGDAAYREAKDFMRMLMPSHAKFVQPYKELTPIFARNGIETQLDGILQPEVGLKSGGYLVMNQTEALVAIDVNSGRSTREHSVEETALQTNLEAAEEVARQLRLRDLAGLVVIDFIDMQEKRNIRTVEKRLKDCLKEDRARIQVGSISHFGLLEMSRQRIRASVLESTTQPCSYCFGRGYVRSQSSLALHVLRATEEYLQHNSDCNIVVKTPAATALYVLNHKRRALTDLENRFNLTIGIEADDSVGREHLVICKTAETAAQITEKQENSAVTVSAPAADNVKTRKNTRAKPAAEKNDKKAAVSENIAESAEQTTSKEQEPAEKKLHAEQAETSEPHTKRKRRRGRRGGRRNKEANARNAAAVAESAEAAVDESQKIAGVGIDASDVSHDENIQKIMPDEIRAGNKAAGSSMEDSKKRSGNRRSRKPRAAAQPHNAHLQEQVQEQADAQQPDTEQDKIHVAAPSLPSEETEAKAVAESAMADSNTALHSAEISPIEEIQEKNAEYALGDMQSNNQTAGTISEASVENYDTSPRKDIIEIPQESDISSSSEPVITSANMEAGKEPVAKKRGWWDTKKNFFKLS